MAVKGIDVVYDGEEKKQIPDVNLTFGNNGNYKTQSIVSFSNATIEDNNDNSSKILNKSFFTLDLKKGAQITIVSYHDSNFVSYILNDGENETDVIRKQFYTLVAVKNMTLTYESVSDNNYLTSIYIDNSSLESFYIDFPVPSVKENAIVNETKFDESQSIEISGTGKENDPIQFTFNMYKAKDGYGINAFEIGEDGNLYLYQERNEDDQRAFEYQLNSETGELEIIYNED